MPLINQRVESIFAHAVALQQDGRFRSTVYCRGKMIYILNQDKTVILRFSLRDSDIEFKNPVTFRANDYDSRELMEKDGFIYFSQSNSDYTRTKRCNVPKEAQEDIEKLWKDTAKERSNQITISGSIFELLENDLSHIEFSMEENVFHARQRNIFDGSLVDIKKKNKGGLLTENSAEDFGPFAVRTNDFQALFSFCGSIDFFFNGNGFVYFRSIDPKWKMDGIISQCLYEEMKGDSGGRQKQKKRRSE